MTAIDTGIIVFYFLVVIGLGFWYKRRASKAENVRITVLNVILGEHHH